MALWLFANAGILGAHGTYPGPGGVGGNTPEASTEVTGAASKAVIACSYLFVASYAPTWGPVRITDRFLLMIQWLINSRFRSPGSTLQKSSPIAFVAKPQPSQPLRTGPSTSLLDTSSLLLSSTSDGTPTSSSVSSVLPCGYTFSFVFRRPRESLLRRSPLCSRTPAVSATSELLPGRLARRPQSHLAWREARILRRSLVRRRSLRHTKLLPRRLSKGLRRC